MKKSFNSWKLLTLLSSLIFAMSCWYLVYAAGGFDNWKVPGGIWMELDSSEWNDLMDNLWVPSWAVMAFDAYECPEGWEEFTAAADKYIRWAAYASDLRAVGGHTTIQLTVDQMPSHYHFIARNAGSYYWDAERFCGELPSGYAQSNYLDTYNRCDNNYDLAFHHPSNDYSYNQPNVWRTNTVWKWQSVDVMDPYIKLLYCKKK